MIVKAFSGPITKQAGEDVIVQGEIGDTFYLLEDGAVDVYISDQPHHHSSSSAVCFLTGVLGCRATTACPFPILALSIGSGASHLVCQCVVLRGKQGHRRMDMCY